MKKSEIPKNINNIKIINEFHQYKNGVCRLFCKCQCICGKFIIRRKDYLYKSYIKNRIVSCGCSNPNKLTGNKSSGWTGFGQVSGHYICSIKTRAKRKNIEFNITAKYAWEIFKKQNGICAISGIPLSLSESKRSNQKMNASIDRIDNTKGYVEGNIQWVYIKINYMRHSLQMEEFLNLCSIIHNYNK